MTGKELREWRERRGLSRKELAELLNSALDRKYNDETVGRWERDTTRGPSKAVERFLEDLTVGGSLEAVLPPTGPPAVEDGAWEPLGETAPADTVPGIGLALESQPTLLSGSAAWSKMCTELWELVATGVGMIGAATGNAALMQDGAIIDADKEALGAAWGKLAETNATLRKMLVGMSEGGAWLQVALVTGTTVSKCWQGHAYLAASTQDAQSVESLADAA